MPIAFIEEDFEFYDVNDVLIPMEEALRNPSRAEFVKVRFRYDKGIFNFIYRKFRRVQEGHVCPLRSSISIVTRARRLGIKPDEPLGQFKGKNGRIYRIRGTHMQQALQQACREAYPDANHQLRRNIHCLMSHCMRVSAAVALQNAGCTEEEIAFRLRWNSDCVKIYLRDCYKNIGRMTEHAVTGAYTVIA